MSELTPEQIAEIRERHLNSPSHKIHKAQSELQQAQRKLAALDYKNHKYQEYEAVDKLSELGYTLLDIYNEKEPFRVIIREKEAEIASLREQMRQEYLARQEAENNA